ncbi:hypothetical protein [Paraburkholderia sp. GAS348]|uniref:hypothetical protein n=1 Tax=Paraburkholderia sp. GAS348 TaxID=3035132 RepID=UPI003D25D288
MVHASARRAINADFEQPEKIQRVHEPKIFLFRHSKEASVRVKHDPREPLIDLLSDGVQLMAARACEPYRTRIYFGGSVANTRAQHGSFFARLDAALTGQTYRIPHGTS